MTKEIEYLKNGIAELKNRNIELAAKQLKKVININPNNDKAWFYLSFTTKNKEKAIKYLEKCIEINPLNEKAWEVKDKIKNKLNSEIEKNDKSNSKNYQREPIEETLTRSRNIINTALGLIAIVLWFSFDAKNDSENIIFTLIYGQYGPHIVATLCLIISLIKKRNPVVWYALGLWFFLISLFILLILPKFHNYICPYCKEGISPDADICPHCMKYFQQEERID